ncbi:MAG: hypothetical protein HYY17_17045 [Planctomycetes bacterium]|nr:hypothetical protein [Planctomycetota bacterium]
MAIIRDEIPPLPPGWLRVSDHRERWEKLRLEAQAEARRLAGILIEEYGATRVWLFGSAAGEWIFHDYSDVDMIVDGLDGRTFTRAWSGLPKRSKFEIDLHERDEFKEADWKRLIPEPVLLAERKDEADRGA